MWDDNRITKAKGELMKTKHMVIMSVVVLLLVLFFRSGYAIDISGWMADTDNVTINLFKTQLNGDEVWTYATPEITKFDNATDTFIFRDLPAGRYVVTPLKEGWLFMPEDVSIDAEWGLD